MKKTIKEYTYTKVWSPFLINSDDFKSSQYPNPSNVPYSAHSLQADNISFGAFSFPASLTQRMTNFRKLELEPTSISNPLDNTNVIPHDGGYYVGDDPANPQIGDMKIHFETVEPATVSVVAQQSNNTLQSYTTQSGGKILLLEYGVVSQGEMFKTALESNTILTWIIRFGGLMLMTIGLSLLLRPLSVLADVVPLFGNIVEAGTGLIAFLMAAAFTMATIAFAWLWFRPLLSGGLILVAAIATWLIKSKMKKGKNKLVDESVAT